MAKMQFTLSDGTRVNTADLVSVEQFRNSHKDLLNQLSAMADRTKSDQELAKLIHHKYRIKNTTGK